MKSSFENNVSFHAFFSLHFTVMSNFLQDNDTETGEHHEELNHDVDELLIIEIQAHPMLWNNTLLEYKRHDKKKIVWNSIANKLGISGKVLSCLSVFNDIL